MEEVFNIVWYEVGEIIKEPQVDYKHCEIEYGSEITKLAVYLKKNFTKEDITEALSQINMLHPLLRRKTNIDKIDFYKKKKLVVKQKIDYINGRLRVEESYLL